MDNNKKVVKIDYVFGKNNELFFKCEGIADIDYDSDKLLERLKEIFSDCSKYSFNNIEEYIVWIKTICCDINLEKLFLSLEIDSDRNFSVCFENDSVVLYIKNDVISDGVNICFKYDKEKGFDFDTSKCMLDSFNNKILRDYIDNEFEMMYVLKNISNVSLNADGKAICKIYKLFYGENPDFSKNETRKKIHIMLALLEQYGISLGDDYYFRLNSNGFVKSLNLTSLLNKYRPLGIVDADLLEVRLTDFALERIKIIGNEVLNYLGNKRDDVCVLNNIAAVLYVSREIMPSGYNYVDVANQLDISQRDAKSNMLLLKKIDNKVKNS